MSDSLAISTQELSRSYQSYQKTEGLWGSVQGFWNRKTVSKVALHQTSLEVRQGEIVGLVGANGAGKTTLLKLLSGLIYPSSGDAKVLGYRPWERSSEYLRQISILLGQKNQLWWDLPAADSYQLLARIYDLDQQAAKKRVQDLAELLGCTHVLNVQLRRLSLGERMKMEIIGSLLHEPKILFLDEPTIGLDVVAQNSIRKFLAEYVKEKNPTVILTSHYMDDIAKLSSRLLLISLGKIVYDGTVQKFVSQTLPKQRVSFSFMTPLEVDQTLTGGWHLAKAQAHYQIEVETSRIPELVAQVTTLAPLQELKIEEANFEDVIHAFMAKESRVPSPRHSV